MTDLVMTGASSDELWPLVRDYHYSQRMPSAIQHCFAARLEGGLFGHTGEVQAGCIFGISANNSWPPNVLELQRLVRRDDLKFPLSKLVGFALKWLRKNTIVPFAISYADSGQGHHGGIYQATNWKYIRLSKGDTAFRSADGTYHHGRTMTAKYGTRSKEVILRKHPDWTVTNDGDKYLYVYPLKQKWRAIAEERGWEAKPYPKPHRVFV